MCDSVTGHDEGKGAWRSKGVDRGGGGVARGLGGLPPPPPPHFFETIVLAIHQGFNFSCYPPRILIHQYFVLKLILKY